MSDAVENGGMFTEEQIRQLSKYFLSELDSWLRFTARMASSNLPTWPGA